MSLYEFMIGPQAQAFAREVRAFVKNEVDPEYLKAMDREEVKYPRDLFEKYAQKGLLGPRFPREYGGRGLDWHADIAGMAEIGCLGTACAAVLLVSNIVGEAFQSFGTEEQKQKYLKPMLQGRLVSAEALTEPHTGSDFFNLKTRAEDKGDYFLINGQKRFVAGAEGADFFLVYARTNFSEDAHPLQRVSAFIVDRLPEVEVNYIYGLLGTRGGGTGRITFRNARVPRENLIGPLHGGALVFDRMMVPERLSTAATSIGGMHAVLALAAKYANRRVAFGKKIRKFEAINSMIARGITMIDASAGITCQAAHAAEANDPRTRRLVSEAKRFCTDNLWEIVNIAMQIMGGIAYTNVYPLERALRDARLCKIWTGSNEVMDLIIQHEYFNEVLNQSDDHRDIELDAHNASLTEEKVFDESYLIQS